MSAQAGTMSSRAMRVASRLWWPSRRASSVTSMVRVIVSNSLFCGRAGVQDRLPGKQQLGQRKQQVDRHTHQAADHRAVDADSVQVVADPLLDHLHQALV